MNINNLKPFKKGQSGNPKGRPRGRRNTKSILRDYLGVQLSVRTLNGRRQMKVDEILVGGLINRAIYGGSVAAYRLLFEKIGQVENIDDDEDFCPEDDDILQIYQRKLQLQEEQNHEKEGGGISINDQRITDNEHKNSEETVRKQ